VISGNPIRPLSRSTTDRGVAEGSASPRTPVTVTAPIAARSTGPAPLARWLVVPAAVVLPLVVSPATADSYFLPKLIAGWVAVIALLMALGLAAMKGQLRLRRTPLDVPLAIFVASALISTVVAINRNLAFFGSYGRYEGFLTVLLYALLFWLAVQSLDGPQDATLVLRALLGTALVVSLLSILQVALGSLISLGHTETGFSFGGVLRGYGTFGNPNALGAFLAMLLPVAVWEVIAARSLSSRWLAANVVIVLAVGLVVTFSRSSWLGAGIGVVAVLFVAAPPRIRWVTLIAPAAVFLVIAGQSRVGHQTTAPNVVQAAGGRLNTLDAPLAASSSQFRLHVWMDSLSLIASRPIVGYGPDTFGLVYPKFQTGNWAPGAIIDRPHSEPLGIAASQGLLGLAATGAIALVVVRAFWTRRRDLQSVALFGGFVAYATYLLFNFSYLPASLPFCIFAAAALIVWQPGRPVEIAWPPGLAGRILAVGVVGIAALSVVALVAAPYGADVAYRGGLDALASGQRQDAQTLVERARQLAPWQSTYAAAAGSLALNLDAKGQPAPNANWSVARADYMSAARLGTASARVYRYLAISDAALGLQEEAVAAARMAVQLDQYDPANQAELRLLLAR
jgi:O-antigen ligase